ncbi:MAG: hypothetical protein ACFHX7_16565 [Pseudomonadota bacterium]
MLFAVAGTIELTSPVYIRSSYLTIDGCSAPDPGITITQRPDKPQRRGNGVLIEGTRGYTHDIVLQCIRFKGVHDQDPVQQVGAGILSVGADCAQVPLKQRCRGDWLSGAEDGGVANLVFDRITFATSRDKLALWGKIRNVAITRSFFYRNPLALLFSYYGGPYDLQRLDLVLNGNVFAQNNERNPQVRGWTDRLDIRNNIIHDWDAFPPLLALDAVIGDGYGIRIRNEAGERVVNANIVGNLFTGGASAQSRALIYGFKPGMDLQDLGASECLPQGDLYTLTELGRLWTSNNRLPAANCDHYSTTEAPVRRPDWDNRETLPTENLCDALLPAVGAPFRTGLEKDILAQIRIAAGCKSDAAAPLSPDPS